MRKCSVKRLFYPLLRVRHRATFVDVLKAVSRPPPREAHRRAARQVPQRRPRAGK
jgi:hypothetical protein